jgi:hypothetical protein
MDILVCVLLVVKDGTKVALCEGFTTPPQGAFIFLFQADIRRIGRASPRDNIAMTRDLVIPRAGSQLRDGERYAFSLRDSAIGPLQLKWIPSVAGFCLFPACFGAWMDEHHKFGHC